MRIKFYLILFFTLISSSVLAANQWDIGIRTSPGSGSLNSIQFTDLTEDLTPTAGDFVLTRKSTGEVKRLNISELLGGGATSNSFVTINTPAGTNPVASTSTDTLNYATTAPLVVTGDSGTKTITYSWSGAFADAQIPDSFTLNLLSSTLTGLADNQVLMGNGANSGSYITVPDCVDGTESLDFNGTSFVCNTITGGSASNSFETIVTPLGTSPVADGSTDTLTFSGGTGLDITGNSTTDTISFTLSAALQDLADGVITGNLVNTTNPWADNEVSDNLTISGGTITSSVITLLGSASPTPTVNGQIYWNTANFQFIVGNGTGQTVFSDDSKFGKLSYGSADPVTTPEKLGDFYIQTTSPGFCFASGAASAGDWNCIDVGANASVSGPNTGDQTITLTGEVTGSGTGSFATTIGDGITVTGWNLGASTATTPASGDNDTSLATTAFVQGEKKDVILFAVSDETTDLTTGTAKLTFTLPRAFTVDTSLSSGLGCSVVTAPTVSGITVDINEGGTSIMTTNKCTIDATETNSQTAGTAPGVTDTALAQGATITVDIDGVGSGTAGAGLKVWLIGRWQ